MSMNPAKVAMGIALVLVVGAVGIGGNMKQLADNKANAEIAVTEAGDIKPERGKINAKRYNFVGENGSVLTFSITGQEHVLCVQTYRGVDCFQKRLAK